MTIEERHNSIVGALNEVEDTLKEGTKKPNKWDKVLKIAYKLACIMFPISLLFSFVMVYQGNWQTAWTYMFIALMNAGVVFDGSLNK